MALLSRFLCCSLAVSLLAAALPPAPEGRADTGGETSKETAPITTGGTTALDRAVALAGLVEDDEFQSRLKLELVEFHLRKERREEALKLAGTIPGYRRGIALARVAAALARVGAPERIEPLFDQALGQTGFPHPWQSEAIRAEVAIAWAAAGREERSAELAARLTEEGAKLQARAGRALEHARRGEPFDPASFDTPSDAKKLTPELLELARGALQVADLWLAGGKQPRESIAALCLQSEAIVRACKATAGEELLDTGILWRQLGDTKKSAEVIALAMHHLPPGVELQGWRAGYLARMVGLYVEAGDTARIQPILAAARKGIASQHAFHQPPSMCQLAEAELVAGEPDQAEKTWIEATRIALANPNPSSKYLGCTQVAFSIARTERPLPAPVAELIDSLIRGEITAAAPPAQR